VLEPRPLCCDEDRDRAREQGDEDPAHGAESTGPRPEVGTVRLLERGLRFRYVWPIEAS
jgi:hypothetical protein